MSQKIRIQTVRAYNVSLTAPDPLSAFIIYIPVTNRDLLLAKGFIEEFKSFRSTLDERWNREIVDRFGLKRVASKMSERATIIHQGRGKHSRIYVMLYPLPQAIYNVANNAKYRVYSYLWNNAIVIGSRPQSMYLLTDKKLPELWRKKREADDMIKRANELAMMIFEEEVKPKIIELLDKVNWFGGNRDKIIQNIRIKPLHEIYVNLVPIVFDERIVARTLEQSPEVAELIQSSFRQFVNQVLMDVHTKLKPIVEQLMAQRNIRRDIAVTKVDRVVQNVKELGLQSLAEQVRTLYLDIIQHPYKVTQYVDWKDFVNKVNTRLLSL